jgi:hypothetical protein
VRAAECAELVALDVVQRPEQADRRGVVRRGGQGRVARVVPGLERLDLLKPEDRAMLVVFCTTWSVGEVTSLGFGRKSQATKEKSMIEVLPDMPEGVTGIRVSGRLRGDNLREFKPAMEELLKPARSESSRS